MERGSISHPPDRKRINNKATHRQAKSVKGDKWTEVDATLFKVSQIDEMPGSFIEEFGPSKFLPCLAFTEDKMLCLCAGQHVVSLNFIRQIFPFSNENISGTISHDYNRNKTNNTGPKMFQNTTIGFSLSYNLETTSDHL